MIKDLAIASCRVSSDEQLKNNSLNKQRTSVMKAAEDLGVIIPKDYWWSGSVSSKRGRNVERKDLQEMLKVCKKDKRIKYLIVDEPDRFMRSVQEAMYYEVEFNKLDVKVWYASDDDLNNDNMSARFMKMMKYFTAEGSNEERQRKSISGQVMALKEGRFPYHPPIGYKRGQRAAIHEIDPITGPVIKHILINVADGLMSPSEGVRYFNESVIVKNGLRSKFKFDKFRKIYTNCYYAGIVEKDKQVQFRNENGLHEPMISKKRHERLLNIINRKQKMQSGPKFGGNPEFPLNGLIHEECSGNKYPKLIGFNHTNGKTKKIHKRYRCRNCGKYVKACELHAKAKDALFDLTMDEKTERQFIKILKEVWRKNEDNQTAEKALLTREINTLDTELNDLAENMLKPENAYIKVRLEALYKNKESRLRDTRDKLNNQKGAYDKGKAEFAKYALDFSNNLARRYFDDLTVEKREMCKQIIFPGGFFINNNEEIYTPNISPIYGYTSTKKDLLFTEKSLMVRVRRL